MTTTLRFLVALLVLSCATVCTLAGVGGQPTEVVLLKFPDFPQEPYTPAYAGDLVFNWYSNWLQTESRGMEWLEGDPAVNVRGWWTLPHPATYYCQYVWPEGVGLCNSQLLEHDIGEMVAPYFNIYSKLVILYFNIYPGGEGGGHEVDGMVRGIMIAGCWPLGPARMLLIHEGGHAHGLAHAGFWDCPTEDVGLDYLTLTNGGCTTDIHGYGDIYDPMGTSSNDVVTQLTLHFSTYMRSLLGWPQPSNIKIVTPTVTATLTRADIQTSEVQEVRIPFPNDSRFFYTLEYRSNIGVLIRMNNPPDSTGNPTAYVAAETVLLNGTMIDPTHYVDPVINALNPFYDAYRQIAVSLVSLDSTHATVSIGTQLPVVVEPPLPPRHGHGRKKR